MDTNILEKIGLTKNEIKIYLALLKLGSSTTIKIIRETGLHRSRVYEGLERLQDKGLVSFVIKDFKKYFQAEKPNRLITHIDEKKKELEEDKGKIKKILSELVSLENIKKEEINAQIYKGKEGLKTIHNDMLKQGQKIYVLGAKCLIFEELRYFMPNFEKERIKREIKWICLFDKKESYDKFKNHKFMESRLLDEKYKGLGVVNIYSNRVAIVLWKEENPTTFLITSKELADSFKNWFRIIWESTK